MKTKKPLSIAVELLKKSEEAAKKSYTSWSAWVCTAILEKLGCKRNNDLVIQAKANAFERTWGSSTLPGKKLLDAEIKRLKEKE